MARIRSIKPSFFRSEDVSALPLRARLTWIGLWTHCDDAGRTKDNVRLIKGDIWPLDEVSLKDIEDDLETLAAQGRIVRYEVDGKRYLEITNWRDHQAIQKPTESKLPPPPAPVPPSNGSGSPPVVVPETADSPTARKGREGKGREGTRASAQEPPPPKCPTHLDEPNPPPCRACGDHRRHREQWDRNRATAAGQAQQNRARTEAEANRLAIAACPLCDDSGYVGVRQCGHDPDQAERARTWAAEARAAIVVPLHRDTA